MYEAKPSSKEKYGGEISVYSCRKKSATTYCFVIQNSHGEIISCLNRPVSCNVQAPNAKLSLMYIGMR